MNEANRLSRVLRTAIFSGTALILGLIVFLVGCAMYIEIIPTSTGSDDGDGQDVVALITAIAGLLGAVGGLCGGIAALVMARHTLRQQATTSPEPAPAPPD
ncbi:hypothetical protein [Streptomyces chartreusis]